MPIMYVLPDVPTAYHDGRTFYQIAEARQYYVSTCGAIYSSIKDRCLKPADNGIGYLQVWLKLDDGLRKWRKIHRLVAERFLPNPSSLPEVNHIDRDRANCHVDNLEWATHQANIQHSYDTGRVVKSGVEHHRYGAKLSPETKAKMSSQKLGEKHPKFAGWYQVPAGTFPSARAAAEAMGVHARQIDRWCKGGKKRAEGYDFIPAGSDSQTLTQAA